MNELSVNSMDLLIFVVNEKRGDKIVATAKKAGVTGATIILGQGTINSGVLQKLGLDNVNREIVLMIAPPDISDQALTAVADKHKMSKKNHGIGVKIKLNDVLGLSKRHGAMDELNEREDTEQMYQAMFIIVNQGDAEDVMKVAEQCGARGGTVIKGRGAGSKEAQNVFNMEIEPEKDILFIISENHLTDKIADGVSDYLDIEKENNGILFTVDTHETRGLFN